MYGAERDVAVTRTTSGVISCQQQGGTALKAQLFSARPDCHVTSLTGKNAACRSSSIAADSAAGGWSAASVHCTLRCTCSRVHIPTRVVAIPSLRTANWMASSDRSMPRAEHMRAASAAAERSACGAGCQVGGPWQVSSPMHNGEALMTPTPRSCAVEHTSGRRWKAPRTAARL